MTALDRAKALFVIDGVPVIRVTIWSRRLQAWVYVVTERSGQNPPGTYEVTPDEIARMSALVADGWSEADAIYRALGVRVFP